MGVTSLILMGLRGSGKSTLGRRTAERTGRRFVDLDEVTPLLLGGGSIPELWERLGEGRFREAETQALASLELAKTGEPRVIALGGGTPTAPGAAEALGAAAAAGAAAIVYLRARPETLRRRLADHDSATRPSLTGAGTLDEIEAVFAGRDPLYTRLATLVLETDDLEEDEILELLSQLTK